MNYIELENLTTKWASDRGILTNGKVITQAMKLGEEFGELCSHIAKGQDIKDDIGDMIVVLNNIAKMSNTNLKECWEVAYNDIKDRKGFLTKEGVFIKETDPNYASVKPNDLLIDNIAIQREVSLFPAYSISITFSNGSTDYLELLPKEPTFMLSDIKIESLFIGKTKAQFIAYLKTIGDINEGVIND